MKVLGCDMAGATSSAVSFATEPGVQVGPTERMAPDAVRLAGVLVPMKTAPKVLRVRHRFQVSGTDASRTATEMIQFHPTGDGADPAFVGPTMGEHITTINLELAITVIIGRRRPQPAAGRHSIREWPMLVDLGQESGCGIHASLYSNPGPHCCQRVAARARG